MVCQQDQPIVRMVQQHMAGRPVSFHVPGHKNGTVFPASLKEWKNIFPYDLTEITGLDDLHQPEEGIAEAEHLAAEVFGAERTWFLINGSTTGNLAMVMAAFSPGDQVLVQRDAHKSVMNALKLAGVRAVFARPEIDEYTQLSIGISREILADAWARYPSLKGAVITSPSYEGWSSDISSLAEFVHERDGVLLVDEAHGAHFAASPLLPKGALAQGADVVVQSAHKMLPALTMSAYLHVSGSRVSRERLSYYLGMLQSSSPSYLLLASLDAARHYVHTMQHEGWSAEQLSAQKQQLEAVIGSRLIQPPEHVAPDPLKLMVPVPEGYTGWEVQEALEQEHIYSELAGSSYVLWTLPLTSEHINIPLKAVERVWEGLEPRNGNRVPSFSMFELFPRLSEGAREEEPGGEEWILLESAEGRTAAAPLVPYPPGVPLWLEGECMDAGRISYARDLLQNGGRLQGGRKEDNRFFVKVKHREKG
ncbi:lysine decarboxylase [Marinococcus luteus]|uniref:Lysine decarboxylase n=1 Tax=Marinococcus luteus TaxID=1122204 RepID=A0A1H2W5B2_9BACI|nr:aminotransferase class I/II-fold pyridoxal phosphate-dependent enzyme [Marinococcus luteus]SDW75434.1 lysine decarboxylase [Marinococcus luteus]